MSLPGSVAFLMLRASDRRAPRIWTVPFVALVVFVTAALGGCSSSHSSASGPSLRTTTTVASLASPDAAKLQEILDAWLTRNVTPGGVVAVQVGEHAPVIVVAGLADRHRHIPMRADDAFRIGSVTKEFVGETVLALAGRHQLRLDDTIDRWFPSFPHANRITIRDLLTHRSGLPPVGSDAAENQYSMVFTQWIAARLTRQLTPDDVIAFVRDRPLLSAPGTATHYSNLNFILLGEIVAKIEHTDIAHAIRTEVLEPFGLRDSYFAATEHRGPAPVPGLQHVAPNSPPVDENAFPDTGIVSALGAAGAMVSTPTDLLAWSNQYFRARTRGVSNLATSVFQINPTGTGLGVLGFATNGFCVFYQCPPHARFLAVGASGSVPGGSAQVIYDPVNDFTVVTLTNTDDANLEDLTARVAYLTFAGPARYDIAFPTSTTQPSPAP
jgi:D-alanyl-D-alanine carboxypeptidase